MERRLSEGVTRRRKLREMFEELKKARIYAAEEAARKFEADEIYRFDALVQTYFPQRNLISTIIGK